MSKDEQELSKLQCVPCRGDVPPLQNEKIDTLLAKVSNWKLMEDPVDKIQKTIKFKDFEEAMEFVNKVAFVAEEQGHHPDIFIHWNEVTLTLYTHAIDGLFDNDFIMASKIDKLV
jgi:4a-hydroxytetrahydrobiopterin dehydratase